MTPEEIYKSWAPADSIWSPWVIPVPFAQIVCLNIDIGSMRTEAEAYGINLINAQDLVMRSGWDWHWLPGESDRFQSLTARPGLSRSSAVIRRRGMKRCKIACAQSRWT